MPRFSVPDAIAQIELERDWERASNRSRLASKVYLMVATCFLIGLAKYVNFFPIDAAPIYEVTVWVASAYLLVPALCWMASCIWVEWRAYRRLVIFTGHPGAQPDALWQKRFLLYLEFARLGRG